MSSVFINDEIIINSKKIYEIINITNEDTLVIDDFEPYIGIILINKKIYNILEYDKNNIKLKENILLNNIKTGDEIILPSRMSDIMSEVKNEEVVEIKKNIYKILRDVKINGFFYEEDVILYFDEETNFKINNGGYFKLNKTQLNSYNDNSPYSSTHCTIIITGPYKRDCYRTNGICPVNDGGYMDFNNVNIYNLSDSKKTRSDFDFRIGSYIILYNVKLFGMDDSYHHINTENIKIYNFTVVDSYSVELLQSPIEMDNFNSLNCHYGLSFYPPSNIDFVEIKNSFISDSIEKIKRNKNSNILLTNPTFDLIGKYSGSTPVKVCYTQIDQLLDNNANYLTNVDIKYIGSGYSVKSMDTNKNKIKLNESHINFIHLKKNDLILLRNVDNNIYDGETFTITDIIGDSIFVDSEIKNDYNDGTVHELQLRNTDENGIVEEVYIPIEYMNKSSNEIEKYGEVTRVVYDENGVVNNVSIVKPYLKNKTTLIFLENNNSDNGGSDISDNSSSKKLKVKSVKSYNSNFFFNFCNKKNI